MDLYKTYNPEIICLVTQFSITLITIVRIYDNSNQFPVRQFGPGSTIICTLCFLFANIFNFIGKIIVQQTNYKGQCKIYYNNWLLVLAVLYNMLKQLPFLLLAIKILRVSLCFWPRFNKINVQDINNTFVVIMKNQTYFVFIAILYVALINILNIGIFGDINQNNSSMYFQFFCPRRLTNFDTVLSTLRFVYLTFVLYLSLWTYVELDFKKFLILVFLFTNLPIIPHFFITLGKRIFHLQVQNRDSIYYTNFIVQLLNSCVILYYSGINRELNQPAMQGVLQSWQAFHNLKIGMNILFNYAEYLDLHTEIYNHFNCLQSFDYLDQLLKQVHINKHFELKYQLAAVQQILQRNKIVRTKLGQSTANEYKKKCVDGTLTIEGVKRIQKILSNFCESEIFGGWKKTKSYKALKQQFINNGDINQKLSLFQIPIS